MRFDIAKRIKDESEKSEKEKAKYRAPTLFRLNQLIICRHFENTLLLF